MAKKNTQFRFSVAENNDGNYAVHFEGMTIGKVLSLHTALKIRSEQSVVCSDLAEQLKMSIKEKPALATWM